MKTLLFAAGAAAGTLFFVSPHQALTVEALKIFISIFVGTVFIYSAYSALLYPYFLSPLRDIPGPKDHHFLIGQSINQFRSGNPNEPYLSWVRKWPEAPMIRYFSFGHAEALLITNVDLIKEILQAKCYSFRKPSFYVRVVEPIVGKGVVSAEGDEHKMLRRFLSTPFSVANLRKLLPVFKDKARSLTHLLEKQIKLEGGIFEVVSTYSSLTLDIIGIAALGVELENLTSHSKFHECYKKVFDPPLLGQMLIAINAFVPIRWLPLKENRSFKQSNDEVRELTRQIVRQRMAEFREGKPGIEERNDILTHIIRETYKTEKLWTEDEILHQMLTFIAAGHETTAASLVWATHLMTLYPEVQSRLRSEIQALLAQHPNPGYTELESNRYLDNFCREVLRLYCPAISSPRVSDSDQIIGGRRIPKGTTLMIMCAAINQHPRIWGDDADKFDPDRWDRESRGSIDPSAYASFLVGPRMCIGKAFSMLEFKTALVEIMPKFKFEAVHVGEVRLVNPSPLLRPKDGLNVRVKYL